MKKMSILKYKCIYHKKDNFAVKTLVQKIVCNVFYHSIITGYQQIDYNYDPEYLFSPTDGEAKQERANLEHHFPTNFSDFKASRITRPGKFGRVIIAAKDGKSMLRTHLWDQLLYLDQVRIIFQFLWLLKLKLLFLETKRNLNVNDQ